MIELSEPWQVATPIGDAIGLIFDPGGRDEGSRLYCCILATGETWWLRQPEYRINTNITEGRTRLTPFSPEVMERFRPIREAAERLHAAGPARAAQ